MSVELLLKSKNLISFSDLSKSDQFQGAVSSLVSLLGKLPQTAIRTHYLQKVAQRLSGGQGRFALQLEEDLRNQISGQRWHGRSKKIDKPQEITLRERSEADILFTYIHCPNYRSYIRYELRLRELDDFAINASNDEIVGLIKGINIVAKKLNISVDTGKGYRALANISEHGGQEVPHLHFHLFGGESIGKMVQ